jgi:light-regulated signal transduction histidine kinase (bacteriophytochrome)
VTFGVSDAAVQHNVFRSPSAFPDSAAAVDALDLLLIAVAAAAVAAALRARARSRGDAEACARADAASRAANERLAAANERLAAETRRYEAALAECDAKLGTTEKELETFAYSMSHDLRAPLRHIAGYGQLLTQSLGSKLEEEPARYLAVIGNATRQMNALIDGVLAYSRLTRSDLATARVAPREVVDSVIASLENEVRGRRIEWRIGDLPPVEADVGMLKTVYAQLVGNAVKFTAPRDPAIIEIGASAEEAGRAVLFVRDNGVGFDMTYADRLFGIFQRLHTPEEFEGTGIGLATVQRIIARHGGRIWAQAAPGEGATFYFTLARAR